VEVVIEAIGGLLALFSGAGVVIGGL